MHPLHLQRARDSADGANGARGTPDSEGRQDERVVRRRAALGALRRVSSAATGRSRRAHRSASSTCAALRAHPLAAPRYAIVSGAKLDSAALPDAWLDELFVAVNFEEDAEGDVEEQLHNDLNPDRALTRPELIEAFVRFALRKHGCGVGVGGTDAPTPAEAFETVVDEHIRPFAGGDEDADAFRLREVYTKEVDAELRANAPALRRLFER